MTPIETATLLRQFNEWRRGDEDIPQFDPREIGEAIDAAVEMIESLEALRAELKAAHAMALNGVEWRELAQKYEAEIAAMKRQEPVAYMPLATKAALEVGDTGVVWSCRDRGSTDEPLYTLPGAQPAPIEQDTSVRKAWARFSNELHRSPDATYPGMSEAFEKHFSQSFTDREWRTESGVWAAAWKAAKNHGAQPAPSVLECPYPCGWRNLLKHAIEDGAYLARSINEDEPVTENARAVTVLTAMRLRDVLIAINNAAPESAP